MFMSKKNLLIIFGFFIGLLIFTAFVTTTGWTEDYKNIIVNPGFEDDGQAVSGAPKAWTVLDEAKASKTETGFTHSGDYKFTFWLDKAYKTGITQTIKGIPKGEYNFEFWYFSGGGQNELYIELSGFGGNQIRIDVKKSESWANYTHNAPINITKGTCNIKIYTDSNAGNWVNFDDLELYSGKKEQAKKPTAENFVKNFSFEEDGAAVQQIKSWKTESATGDENADKTEKGWTHSGDYKLTHWMDHDYKVKTIQVIEGLKKGKYQFEFWYATGGGQNELSVTLTDTGNKPIQMKLGAAPQWTQYVLEGGVNITSGKCTVTLYTDGKNGNWVNFDDVALYLSDKPLTGFVYTAPEGEREVLKFDTKPVPLSIIGADVSTLQKAEDLGAKFYDLDGKRDGLLNILKANGFNYIRLRTWHTPGDGYLNKGKILIMAKRIKDLGLKFLLDIHYSDTWADPGKQFTPKAWEGLSIDKLKKAVYDYTKDLLDALKKQNTVPEIVQVGNEIRGGMLWPIGKLGEWTNFADLLKSAVKGVRDSVGNKTRIMIHIDTGADNEKCVWFYDNVAKNKIDYDIIGLSYYPFWHGKMSAMYKNLNDLVDRYNKDIILVEVAFPNSIEEGDQEKNVINDKEVITRTGYIPTLAGQIEFFTDLIEAIKHVKNGRCLGLMYWEPAWIPLKGLGWDPDNPKSGSGWENMGLFDMNGKALESIKIFSEKAK